MIAAPVAVGIGHMGELVAMSFLAVAGTMVLVAAVDVPFKLWEHHRQLKMTKEEARQEAKETEGNPQVKGRIRAQQREIARAIQEGSRAYLSRQFRTLAVFVVLLFFFLLLLEADSGSVRIGRSVAFLVGAVFSGPVV